jgi:hypothetical protein
MDNIVVVPVAYDETTEQFTDQNVTEPTHYYVYAPSASVAGYLHKDDARDLFKAFQKHF